MKLHRITLFAGWAVVSLLAVAGFAAFSAGGETADTDEVGPQIAAGIGHNAGAVSALTFLYLAEEPLPPAPDPDSGLTQALEIRRYLAPATTAPGPQTTASGTYVRSKYLSESQVRELVARYFHPEDVNRALRIAWCESSFNPNNINPTSGAGGLFQHLPRFWGERSAAAGFPGADILDPEANVAVAAWLLYEFPGGWSHWTCNA